MVDVTKKEGFRGFRTVEEAFKENPKIYDTINKALQNGSVASVNVGAPESRVDIDIDIDIDIDPYATVAPVSPAQSPATTTNTNSTDTNSTNGTKPFRLK